MTGMTDGELAEIGERIKKDAVNGETAYADRARLYAEVLRLRPAPIEAADCKACEHKWRLPHTGNCETTRRLGLVAIPPLAPAPEDFKAYPDYVAAVSAWGFAHQPVTAAHLVDVLERGGYKAMAATIRAAFEK